ncbi:MAG: FISUMP domain-containing protein, partial [Syntrophothermus sp.]
FILKPGADLSSIRIKISGAGISLQPDGSLLLKTAIGPIKEIIPESYTERNGIKTTVNCRFYDRGDDVYGIATDSRVPPDTKLVIDPMPERIWGTYFGGEGYETLMNGDVDGTGNLYFGGGTNLSTNLATAGAFQTTLQGITNGFVGKFTPGGSRIWSTYFGGTLSDNFRGITITDDNLYLYIAGEATSPGLATPGAFQVTLGSVVAQDALLVKLDTSGARIWSTYYGGTASDIGYCCDADPAGGVYVMGTTKSSNAIATPGTYQTTYHGENDVFLTRFDASGNRLWGTYYGGECNEMPAEIGCPTSGNYVYIAGSTCSTTQIAGPGVFQSTLSGTGTADGFLAKITSMGTREWGTYFGGTNDDAIRTLIIDDNFLYFSGVTQSDGMASPGAYQTSLNGISDGFLTKFNTNCQRIWSTYFGGPEDEIARVFRGDAGEIFITGTTGSSIGIATPDAYQQFYGGNSDGMLIKFDTAGTPAWGTYYGGDQWENLYSGFYYDVHHIYCFGATNSLTSIASPGAFQVSHGGGGSDLMMVRFDACPYPDAPGAITGEDTLCSPATDVQYSVPPITNATGYHWNLPPGAVITSGINTRSITVDFSGTATSGNISVYGTANCGNGDSTYIPLTVTPGTTLLVVPAVTEDTVCAGTMVTFSAVVFFGGTDLSYEWKVNGITRGTSPTFSWVPQNGDEVTCVVTSAISTCIANNPATSSPIVMTVNPVLPVSVTIAASQNPVCGNVPVTFTTVPVNGGTTPSYQWMVNGLNAGSNTPVFTYTPQQNDNVTCQLSASGLACLTNNPAISDTIQMHLLETPEVIFSKCNDSVTTTSAKPFRLRGAIPPGGIYSGPGVNSLTGIFTPSLAGTGLKNITYSYTNSGGCQDMAVRTIEVRSPVPFTCGNNFIDIRNNRSYATARIGSQCWFSEDLDYGIPVARSQHQRDNCIVEKYQLIAGNQQTTRYQWDEMMDYSDLAGDKGLCPPGWHVPAENEWNQLYANYTNNAFAGAPLKFSGFSGFNALLTGSEHQNTGWNYQGFAVFFWSSSSHGSYKAWSEGMNSYDPSVSRYPSSRQNAFAVRCVKD